MRRRNHNVRLNLMLKAKVGINIRCRNLPCRNGTNDRSRAGNRVTAGEYVIHIRNRAGILRLNHALKGLNADGFKGTRVYRLPDGNNHIITCDTEFGYIRRNGLGSAILAVRPDNLRNCPQRRNLALCILFDACRCLQG